MVPLHSHKLTATLQHVLCEDAESPQRNPLISRIDVRAGHGAGKPTEKIIAGAQPAGLRCDMYVRSFQPSKCVRDGFAVRAC